MNEEEYESFCQSKRAPSAKGLLLGLELEQELRGDVDYYLVRLKTGFRSARDGSLRAGGVEFISHAERPEVLKSQVDALFKFLKEVDAAPQESHRTSTHVHINTGDLTEEQILIFACLYWILEPVLFELASPNRKGNPFCSAGQAIKYKITENCFNYRNPFYNIAGNEDGVKYSSLNFASLQKLNTVEVRLMHGLTSAEKVKNWLTVLVDIYERAKEYRSLKALKKDFLETPFTTFCKACFKNSFGIVVKNLKARAKFEDLQKLLHDGYASCLCVFETDEVFNEARFFVKNIEEVRRKQREELLKLLENAQPDNFAL